MPSMPIRAGLLVAAVGVCAWLAFGLRAVGLQEDGDAVLQGAQRDRVSPAMVAEARRSLSRSAKLNPDQAPLVTEGFLLAVTGRRAQAYEKAKQLTAKEPEDFNAWYLTYLTHPSLAGVAQAKMRVAALNPWLGDRLQ